MNYGTFVDAHTVRHERLLPGPIERVWSFLTENDGLSTWLGHATVPPTPGSTFVLAFVHQGDDDPDDEHQMHGETRIFEPYRLLEYRWSESGRDELVRFELSPVNDRVRLVLTHAQLQPERALGVGPGWHVHLDVLEARLGDGELFAFFERYEALRPAYDERYEALTAAARP